MSSFIRPPGKGKSKHIPSDDYALSPPSWVARFLIKANLPKPDFIDKLDDKLLSTVFKKLSLNDRIRIRVVSRRWLKVVHELLEPMTKLAVSGHEKECIYPKLLKENSLETAEPLALGLNAEHTLVMPVRCILPEIFTVLPKIFPNVTELLIAPMHAYPLCHFAFTFMKIWPTTVTRLTIFYPFKSFCNTDNDFVDRLTAYIDQQMPQLTSLHLFLPLLVIAVKDKKPYFVEGLRPFQAMKRLVELSVWNYPKEMEEELMAQVGTECKVIKYKSKGNERRASF